MKPGDPSEQSHPITLYTESSPLNLRYAEFGRHKFKPHPWSVVRLGRELDEHGNPRTGRQSASITGVNGLEPGHEYEVSLNEEALRQCVMWAPVTKEAILLESGYKGPGSRLEDYPWIVDHPRDFRVGKA